MSNLIQLLPESLSNQIAAGEVVQRPASAVKELLENAIDAGAQSIQLIVKEGGKTLIQVIDNGNGMNIIDARMCFERHATSKIKSTEDLFRINTKGFRGEALAAIAAVSQVELKTKTEDDELGTKILIEGGKFVEQEACQVAKGASFSVKNLFFNVPARRNFLKDDSVELKHILEEFERVALAHANIAFTFFSNGNEIFRLPSGNLAQRIIGLLGGRFKEKLITIQEETPYLKISGYLTKPDMAVKRRGVNYFFVNNRFIKSGYMHTAIMNGYTELISKEYQPYYFVFLELPPESIDINIHPTKTEIKFEDERTVFMLLQSTVQRALGKAGVAPQLEFNSEQSFEPDFTKRFSEVKIPGITVNPNYNPFQRHSGNSSGSTYKGGEFSSQLGATNWNQEFDKYRNESSDSRIDSPIENTETLINETSEKTDFTVIQVKNKYLLTESEGGFLIIDQQRAHERILYEKYKNAFTSSVSSQQELFPLSNEYSVNDYMLLMELKDDLKFLGFDLEAFGKNTIVIHGTPADLQEKNAIEILDSVLENYKLNNLEVKAERRENICRSMAVSTSIKNGKKLNEQEMKKLLFDLFTCQNFSYSPSGKPILNETNVEDIDKLFKKRN
ncbi:MAG: DNA mismatch repair endonuclease MutL [Bacteroidota bacterium]|jgi:DNA mismatch repair protein MutL